MKIQLQPADILLARSNNLVSKSFRFLTGIVGEKKTKVNQVGIVVNEGLLHDAFVIQSLNVVKKHTVWEQYGPLKEDLVAVYRPLNLTANEINTIVLEAEEQLVRKYSFRKIVVHRIDRLLLGTYFFRRILNDGRYPVSSWLVAHAYSKADKNFGCSPGTAEPDDIWDFVNSNRDKYSKIFHLGSIWKDGLNKTG